MLGCRLRYQQHGTGGRCAQVAQGGELMLGRKGLRWCECECMVSASACVHRFNKAVARREYDDGNSCNRKISWGCHRTNGDGLRVCFEYLERLIKGKP